MKLKPADLRLEAFHPMSGARMEAIRITSVSIRAAPSGIENLYVADASLCRPPSSINAMMTIIACATHVAATLVRALAG